MLLLADKQILDTGRKAGNNKMFESKDIVQHLSKLAIILTIVAYNSWMIKCFVTRKKLQKNFEPRMIQALDFVNKLYSSKFQVPSPGALVREQGT